jgi:pyrimidine-nucleoside phosphorylase/thymidine phosphorylase
MGKRVTALITAMEEPLGLLVGNALEVVEAIDLLRGGGPADLREITMALAAEMLLLAGRAPDLAAARTQAEAAVADGRALRKLEEVVAAQGGDPRAISDPSRLPRAPLQREVPAPAAGMVQAIDAQEIGLAAMGLGAGRARVDDRIDPAVGIALLRKVGQEVRRGEPLAILHCSAGGGEPPEAVSARVAAAFRIGVTAPPPTPLILQRIG